MSERSVLIVEDTRPVSSVIQDAMELAGYNTRAAGTCAAGLALSLEQVPNLLILDIGLPDGSGWTLLEDIRREYRDGKLPVIVISSNQISRSELRHHKVDRYVPKPFDMGHLLEEAEKLLPRS